ncbi:MAG TPA: ABC transporter ATP-binding protein [Vicinamibacterales bacterium]|nr:ABC transporter ATP-binding protein [Vicinamibacterales bacterium]HPW20986.1 ABC transporter ATP-binding protein [Vicinamibacterales bacterium]
MSSAPPTIAIRAANLTRRYGDILAVDDLSLEVRRGEILGLLGPNGAGKTTTLRMLCGLLRPDSGRVEIDGRPLKAGRPGGLPAIGLSPQAIVVWELLTVFEQLDFMGRAYGLPRRAARARAEALLTAFGLEEKRDRLGRTLSGGLQRRLNIALAFAHDPPIVLLDEPQAGLDPQSRVLVRDYIGSLRGRVTVIVTTHDMDEAERVADRVCIVDRGRILALDTVDAIKGRLGEGDVIEAEFGGADAAALDALAAALARGGRPCARRGTCLRFTSADGFSAMPDLLQAASALGLQARRLAVRKQTLEDVFIRLTGRGLRE